MPSKKTRYTSSCIAHAIEYVQKYKDLGETCGNPYKDFQVAAGTSVPCKAAGLAKKALIIEQWNPTKAIARLSSGAAGC